jgi:ferredoxin
MPNSITEVNIPDILGNRCVHQHIEQASCRACVDACPKHAWILTDELLGIDSDACDNCGLCAPVCPEGAIQHDHSPLPGRWKDRLIALSACEKAQTSKHPEAVIPCIHILGLHNLLTLQQQGYTIFITSSGDCDNCERGNNTRLVDTTRTLNQLLKQRSLPAVRTDNLPAKKWDALAENIIPFEPEETMTRRNFLRKAISNLTEQGLEFAGLRETEDDQYLPVGKLIPASLNKQPPLYPWSPEILPKSCNGCDACVRICPHGAIQWTIINEGEEGYQLDAAECTGCNLCVDVCEMNAVIINRNTPQTQTVIPLHSQKCSACGVPFHIPETSDRVDQKLCRICKKTNHSRYLFRVE